MTTKIYTAKSNAIRAARKAELDEYSITGDKASGFMVVATCRHPAQTEAYSEKGFACENLYDEQSAPTYADVADRDYNAKLALDAYKAKAKLPADEDEQPVEEASEAGEEDLEPSEEEIQDYYDSHFAVAYIAHGGNNPRGRCKALRAIAAGWDGTRKQFIDAAVANGILASTANANYQAGYSK